MKFCKTLKEKITAWRHVRSQLRVTQTPKDGLDSHFLGDQEKIVFTCKIERLIESFITLVWIDQLERRGRSQWTNSERSICRSTINVNNAEESKESCIKIYIFFEIQFTWYEFFWVVGCILYIEIAGRKQTKIQTNIE